MNKVRAGNMLNEIISSETSFVARVAVWIAYYPLMRALAATLDRFERTISKRYEVQQDTAATGFVVSSEVE